MNDKDYEQLATEIYNTVNSYTGIDIAHVMPFAQLPQRLQEAYIQAAKDAAKGALTRRLREALISEEELQTLGAVIYNDVQVKLEASPVVPFALAARTVRAAYIQGAKDAAVFVKNSVFRHANEEEQSEQAE